MAIIKTCIKDNIEKWYDDVYNYNELINFSANKWYRCNIMNEKGKETKQSPFLRSFPMKLNIGIVSGCILAKTNLCHVGGSQSGCYMGQRPYNPDDDMKFEDFTRIIDEAAEKGCIKIELCGAGDPNEHKDFIKMLKYIKESKPLSSGFPTSGTHLTDELMKVVSDCNTFIYLSWYGTEYSFKALNKLIEYDRNVNINFILSKETLSDAIYFMKTGELFYKDHNGNKKTVNLSRAQNGHILFCPYKPIGKGCISNTLSSDDESLQEFIELVKEQKKYRKLYNTMIDGCRIPNIFPKDTINYSCTPGSLAMFISPDMIATPCSFDREFKYGVDISNNTLEYAWNSEKFKQFKDIIYKDKFFNGRFYCTDTCPIKIAYDINI